MNLITCFIFVSLLVLASGCKKSSDEKSSIDSKSPSREIAATRIDEDPKPYPITYAADQSALVHLKRDVHDGWTMVRNKKVFYVKGAGGTASLKRLAETGANAVRTWGIDESTATLLDEAHENGLAVCVGLWLGHERHGFDYEDFDQVEKQLNEVLAAVRKFKNHPALLMWGIGNEMEGYEQGDNPAIWSHVQFLASQIKKEDPNHPTMTVIAEIGGRKVESIHKLCPDVDVIGINSYGGATSIPARYKKQKGSKPYLVTEFGPVGTWEVPKNEFGAIEEPNPSIKAGQYRDSYQSLKRDPMCLGSFAFLWGNKEEATSTWFGMLLANGKKTEAVDVMSKLWSGKEPKNRCPKINRFELIGSNLVEKGQTVRVELDASDPEGKSLNVEWVLMRDPQNYITGGDFQKSPPRFDSALQKSDPSFAEFKIPDEPGVYRVFVYVDDGTDGGASANLPVLVKGKVQIEKSEETKLPYVVYDEPSDKQIYVPSGWMGSRNDIQLDPKCTDAPKSGKHCMQCQYNRSDAWGGVVWQSPADDWGDKPGGLNLTGAKNLKFWAKGANGGETITFGFGLLGKDKKFHDTCKKEIKVDLTDQWKEYLIKIDSGDMSRIKTGFYWTVAGQGSDLKFYLDNIRFGNE